MTPQQLDLLAAIPQRLDRTLAAQVARAAGERAIALGAEKARRVAPAFIERACAHVLAYLREHGVSSGELLTDSCKLAGIRSTSDKHMGCVYRSLLRAGLIRWAGDARRTKGHLTRGGSLYSLVR
jgi:hypothetical protein